MSDKKCYHGRGSYGKTLCRTIDSLGSMKSASDGIHRFNTGRTGKDFSNSVPKRYAFQVETVSKVDCDNLKSVYDEEVRGEYPCTTCHETDLDDDKIMQLW